MSKETVRADALSDAALRSAGEVNVLLSLLLPSTPHSPPPLLKFKLAFVLVHRFGMGSESPRKDAEYDRPAAEDATGEPDLGGGALRNAAAPAAQERDALARVDARAGTLSGSATSAAVRPIKRINASRSTSAGIAITTLENRGTRPTK